MDQGKLSVASVAVDVAREVFDTFSDKTVLVIGAGKMGDLTLQHLKTLNPGRILVTNRSPDRAEAAAARWGGRAVPFDRLNQALIEADVVVSTTAADEPIVTYDQYVRVQRARRNRLALILDIAIPRDFDPRVGELDQVMLYNVDDLRAQAEENRRRAQKGVDPALAIIERETAACFAALRHQRHAGAVLRAARRQRRRHPPPRAGRPLRRLPRPDRPASARRSPTWPAASRTSSSTTPAPPSAPPPAAPGRPTTPTPSSTPSATSSAWPTAERADPRLLPMSFLVMMPGAWARDAPRPDAPRSKEGTPTMTPRRPLPLPLLAAALLGLLAPAPSRAFDIPSYWIVNLGATSPASSAYLTPSLKAGPAPGTLVDADTAAPAFTFEKPVTPTGPAVSGSPTVSSLIKLDTNSSGQSAGFEVVSIFPPTPAPAVRRSITCWSRTTPWWCPLRRRDGPLRDVPVFGLVPLHRLGHRRPRLDRRPRRPRTAWRTTTCCCPAPTSRPCPSPARW